MTTIAVPLRKTYSRPQQPARVATVENAPFSLMAAASAGFMALFIGFIALYAKLSFIQDMHVVGKASLGFLFIIVAPACALYFSIVALRGYIKNPSPVRGMPLAYASFVLSAIYFVTALALPFVLLGSYFLYVYIW